MPMTAKTRLEENKLNRVQTTDAFWRSAGVLVSELTFKWHSLMFLKLYGVSKKKVFHKSEDKMLKKMKMTLQRAENLVHVQQHDGKSFYKKIFV